MTIIEIIIIMMIIARLTRMKMRKRMRIIYDEDAMFDDDKDVMFDNDKDVMFDDDKDVMFDDDKDVMFDEHVML
jgi:hypothetical protein